MNFFKKLFHEAMIRDDDPNAVLDFNHNINPDIIGPAPALPDAEYWSGGPVYDPYAADYARARADIYPDHGESPSLDDIAAAHATLDGDPMEADADADEIGSAGTDEYLRDMAAERFANNYGHLIPHVYDTSSLTDLVGSIPSEEEIDQARADALENDIESNMAGEGEPIRRGDFYPSNVA